MRLTAKENTIVIGAFEAQSIAFCRKRNKTTVL
jgi:hypothetical protein